jgi:hypothetical protein
MIAIQKVKEGLSDPSKVTRHLYHQSMRLPKAGYLSVTSRYPFGTNIFDLDWDLLILLDTCRVDACKELSKEYSFLNDVGSIRSVGSMSAEWIANTFVTEYRDQINDTAYLSNNVHSERTLVDRNLPEKHVKAEFAPTNWNMVEASEVGHLEHVWQYANFIDGNDAICTSPRVIVDRTIEFCRGRGEEFNRKIVHIEQPHAPYFHAAKRAGREPKPHERNPWGFLRSGGDVDKVWEAYLEEARAALDQVEILLRNVDADTVAISADHGEGIGSWGTYHHPVGSLNPHVKHVPWVTTSAQDEQTVEPEVHRSKQTTTAEEQLKALGYLKS